MSQAQTRIGLIGYGQIGQAVHKMIDNNEDNGMVVVFVHDSSPPPYKTCPLAWSWRISANSSRGNPI